MIESLKQFRELWGWSQAFIAAMLRVSRSTVSRWERGESTPATSNQEKIDALLQAIEQASGRRRTPPEVRIAGDKVEGDQTIGRDKVAGHVITTAEGPVYVVEGNLIVVASPDDLPGFLRSNTSA